MTRNSKPTQWHCLSVLAGAFCLAMAANVYAEETAKPCADDAAKFCKGVEQGEGRIARCMKEHENELSPACKQNIAKAKERVKEAAEACKGDIEKVCKDVKPGGGRILRCLKQHEDTLSPACKAEFQQGKGRK
ncbi:MAG TPA: cysteine rich repeat-containing protein [Gallionellaceae bacterium]|nr:cysteine rich repeat-containing protein [Gallionellaceae bacterium]